jgi:hypothetical protein
MPRTTKKTPTKRQNSKAKKPAKSAAKRAKYKKTTAISIRLPEEIIEDGAKPKFFINYVLHTGELKTRPCTHKVWKDINIEELFKKFRYEFDIFEDAGTGVVQHLNSRLKSEHLPVGFNEADIVDSTVTHEAAHLEVTVSPDDELSVQRAPSSCTQATEEEVIDSLAADLSVKSGDYILGKYRVDEIREREGHKTIYVDTTFKE